MELLACLIVFSPLVCGLIVSLFGCLFGKLINDRISQCITIGGVAFSMLASWALFYEVGLENQGLYVPLLSWLSVGSLKVSWALYIDTVSSVMLVVVTTVSATVHLYSVGYMSRDPSIPRFMAYLSFFTFFMLMLVTASNFVQLFFGWEGVGLASYLLIGFWHQKTPPNRAAMKAFIMNRVADVALVLGIAAVYLIFKTLNFQAVFELAMLKANDTFSFLGVELPVITTICVLFFVGAMGKSAQIGFHPWLADAMEGPTPVSALIHAATMVTAGVFLVVRLSPLFELSPAALSVVVIVGAFTAFFAGTVALVQNDIKRVIAYSTCSQLGYMFFAAGLSAYSAALFHLFTHAFFKALLFLGAGSVIHAMSNEQDLQRMGGLARLIPMTYVLMLIGSVALVGLPFLSGYYSKETILAVAWGTESWLGQMAFWVGVTTAFLTAFYSWRLLFLAFHGTPRSDEHVVAHVHESPNVMIAPMVLLAFGAIGAGYLFYGLFIENHHNFWGGSLVTQPQAHTLAAVEEVGKWEGVFLHVLPMVVVLSGILIAAVSYVFYPEWPKRLARQFKELYAFLLNKWYFDELYERIFLRPTQAFSRFLWSTGDQRAD
jgi:NADH-quinone oxidoreductase subunit L